MMSLKREDHEDVDDELSKSLPTVSTDSQDLNYHESSREELGGAVSASTGGVEEDVGGPTPSPSIGPSSSGEQGGAAKKTVPKKKSKPAVKYCKAPQAPKRFKSAFIFYTMERHKQIRATLKTKPKKGGDKTPDVAKLISQEWRHLPRDERAFWEDKASLDKERFEVEKSMYTGPWKVPAKKKSQKDPSAPKRPMSSFLSFSNANRAEIKVRYPGISNTEASKVLARMWKEAPEEEKRDHIEREAELRQVYKVEMAAWKEKTKREEDAARQSREQMALDIIASKGKHGQAHHQAQHHAHAHHPYPPPPAMASGGGAEPIGPSSAAAAAVPYHGSAGEYAAGSAPPPYHTPSSYHDAQQQQPYGGPAGGEHHPQRQGSTEQQHADEQQRGGGAPQLPQQDPRSMYTPHQQQMMAGGGPPPHPHMYGQAYSYPPHPYAYPGAQHPAWQQQGGGHPHAPQASSHHSWAHPLQQAPSRKGDDEEGGQQSAVAHQQQHPSHPYWQSQGGHPPPQAGYYPGQQPPYPGAAAAGGGPHGYYPYGAGPPGAPPPHVAAYGGYPPPPQSLQDQPSQQHPPHQSRQQESQRQGPPHEHMNRAMTIGEGALPPPEEQRQRPLHESQGKESMSDALDQSHRGCSRDDDEGGQPPPQHYPYQQHHWGGPPPPPYGGTYPSQPHDENRSPLRNSPPTAEGQRIRTPWATPDNAEDDRSGGGHIGSGRDGSEPQGHHYPSPPREVAFASYHQHPTSHAPSLQGHPQYPSHSPDGRERGRGQHRHRGESMEEGGDFEPSAYNAHSM